MGAPGANKLHEYEDVSDPDRIEQGDVIEWLPAFAESPWRKFGIVVTADCDLAWGKHGGVISYVPALLSDDFIWREFRGPFFRARRDEALQSAVKLANMAIKKLTSQDSNLSRSAIQDWLARVGRDGLLDEIGVTDNARVKLDAVLEQILVCDEVLGAPDFDMPLLERAFAATASKGGRDALIRKIEDQWKQLPGDIFHLPSLPTGDEKGVFLMLRHIRQLSVAEIAGRPDDIERGDAKVKRVARVCAPYRYAITQNLARVFADIGLPEDHESRRKSSAQRFFDTWN